MFQSLLIANRGEIACRIIRTCRRLGIRTIAVFSEADDKALHVEMADSRYCIGPANARESYLNAEVIVETARRARAEAIHPGYGFLAEKVDLPELCAKYGLVWVGPAARCIRLMGSKVEAKTAASNLGLVSVPGYNGDNQDRECLLLEAERIGYPVLIKASAGGGGKGMRRVDQAKDFAAALLVVKREAMGAFADDHVLLEKYITHARHLEVQIAADKHGNVVHLFERECSIQRNFQKLIEETPAPRLSQATRSRLFEAAVSLARGIDYDSLGTVEFVLDADRGEVPYFLEMNTRLQVEHPVTEMVTGLDLVELQLRIAADEPLPLQQESIVSRGAAIEVRLNAERPMDAYRPSSGRISAWRPPVVEGNTLRIDTGITEGATVTPFYDSLVAKIVAHGSDRTSAISTLSNALESLVILGVDTNQGMLLEVLSNQSFLQEKLSTGFLADEFPSGWRPREDDEALRRVIAAGTWLLDRRRNREGQNGTVPANPWLRLAGFRLTATGGVSGRTDLLVGPPDKEPVNVVITCQGEALVTELEGQGLELRDLGDRVAVKAGSSLEFVSVCVADNIVWLSRRGRASSFVVVPRVSAVVGKMTEVAAASNVVAPMAGLVSAVELAVGQLVRKDSVAVVMEAMKLVITLLAPADGVVRAVHCAPGQPVVGGRCLIEIEPVPGTPTCMGASPTAK